MPRDAGRGTRGASVGKGKGSKVAGAAAAGSRRSTAEARDASESNASPVPRPASLGRDKQLELYYYMRLTRTLEERLVALYRQTKVIGGLFRSLGQEADAVGSAYALEKRDILSPLIRNLGSMLVKGATPLEILRQYMAKGDSPTRGRELNIHFGDLERGFIGQISPLGDMVPVMAGVTLTFRMRGEDRVGLVYVGDGATSTGAFHEGVNLAAVMHCPLVVVVENNGYAYSTPTARQTAAKRFVDKAIGYGIPGEQADGNDVMDTYEATKRAVDRARRGEGASLVELLTYRRKGHAEHDNQSYVPAGEIERWERENDPIDRYAERLRRDGVDPQELVAIDERVHREVDAATDEAERSPMPEGPDALVGVYADPPAAEKPWYRRGAGEAGGGRSDRVEGWGTFNG